MPAARCVPSWAQPSALLLRAPGLVLLGAALVGCSVVTDSEVTTYAAIAAASPGLLRGSKQTLSATVWQRSGSGDSTEVRNVELVWTTSDPTLATVAAADDRSATVTGVNPGIVTLTASAPGFEGAAPSGCRLRRPPGTPSRWDPAST